MAELSMLLYDEGRPGGAKQAPKVRAILVAAGYLEAEGGAPGTFVLKIDDVDGRTGTTTFWLAVVEDPARPVIDEINATFG